MKQKNDSNIKAVNVSKKANNNNKNVEQINFIFISQSVERRFANC